MVKLSDLQKKSHAAFQTTTVCLAYMILFTVAMLTHMHSKESLFVCLFVYLFCLFVCLFVDADDGVELLEYEASIEGIIGCYTEYRHRDAAYDNTLESLWEKDRHFWN